MAATPVSKNLSRVFRQTELRKLETGQFMGSSRCQPWLDGNLRYQPSIARNYISLYTSPNETVFNLPKRTEDRSRLPGMWRRGCKLGGVQVRVLRPLWCPGPLLPPAVIATPVPPPHHRRGLKTKTRNDRLSAQRRGLPTTPTCRPPPAQACTHAVSLTKHRIQQLNRTTTQLKVSHCQNTFPL